MGRKKKPPMQALATDLETIAAAMGVPSGRVTTDELQALHAGLIQTTSPLKDAVENVLNQRKLAGEYRCLFKELQAMLIDEEQQFYEKSALVPLVIDHERWETVIGEMIGILYRLT